MAEDGRELVGDFAREEIFEFIDPNAEFWSYNAAYDWVMLNSTLAKRLPGFCRDIRQLAESQPHIQLEPPEASYTTKTLAKWTRSTYHFLTGPDPAMRAACLEEHKRGNYITSEELLAQLRSRMKRYEVIFTNPEVIWRGSFDKWPTFDAVRQEIVKVDGSASLYAWDILKAVRDRWPCPPGPAMLPVIRKGTVSIHEKT